MNKKIITKLKNKKGITLIALVITIIVLIILAGVSINLILGENGIIAKARQAKEENRYATVEETKALWKADVESDNYTEIKTAESLDEVINRLWKNGSITDQEKDALLAGESITIAGKEISFKEEQTETRLLDMFILGESCTEENCKNKEHLHVGDYVNYQVGTGSVTVGQDETGYNEQQTYTADASVNWRVLGLSEDRQHVLLISGSPIKKDGEDPYLVLQGAEGYIYGKNILKKICAIYNNPDLAEETRSITTEDINTILGVEVADNKVYLKSDVDKKDLNIFTSLGKTYTYKTGNYAPENYTGTGERKIGEAVELTAYAYDYKDIEMNNTIKEMLFDQTSTNDNKEKEYWLSDIGTYNTSDAMMYFGVNVVGGGGVGGGFSLLTTDGDLASRAYAVRPVVSLKSDITSEQVSKITEEVTEQKWVTKAGKRGDGTLQGDKGKVVE